MLYRGKTYTFSDMKKAWYELVEKLQKEEKMDKLPGTSVVCSNCMQLVRVELVKEEYLMSRKLWHYKGRCEKCSLNVYVSFMKVKKDEWNSLQMNKKNYQVPDEEEV